MKKNRSLYKLLGVLISISMLFSLAPSVVAVEVLEAAENALSEFSENISAQAESYNSTAITVTEPSQDSDGYYLIGTAGELYWFADYANTVNSSAKGKLTSDIVINENVLTQDGVLNGDGSGFVVWSPIGYYNVYNGTDYVLYSGTFDGQGYSISGLYFNDSKAIRVGLFGYTQGASITNIVIKDSYFLAKDSVGSVAGSCESTTMSGCSNAGVVIGEDSVGGVVGYLDSDQPLSDCSNSGTVTASKNGAGGVAGICTTILKNCYNTGNISGQDDIGGVAGILNGAENCYNTGNVTATRDFAGGIAAESSEGNDIMLCYNTGEIKTAYCAGGIVGNGLEAVINCYNIGSVTAEEYAGGIASSAGTVQYCFNIGTVTCTADTQSAGGVVTNIATYNPSDIYYLEGCAATARGYYEDDTENNVYSKTAEEFASGEVTYLLNKGVTDGTQAWYQTLETDDYPVFEGETVYNTYTYSDCSKKEVISEYSNSDSETAPDHVFSGSVCTVCGGYVQPEKDSDGYYLIGTAGELYWFAEYVNAGNAQVNAKLTADIVVNENLLESITYDEEGNVTNGDSFNLWNPIGYRVSNSENAPFSGVFDGQGYEVSGLYYNNVTDGSYIGLFGYALSATIKNIGLADSYIAAMQYVGGICGNLKDTSDAPGEISGCYNTSSIKGAMTVAGICGSAGSYTVISNCYNEGEITGLNITYNYDENTVLNLGGLAGGIMGFGRCSITDCYNTGEISGYVEIGGISGYSIGSVTRCYNTGNISAETSQAGGIAGDSYDCITTDCYNTGNVSAGTTCAGGINGRNQSDCSIVNCYNSGTVTGTTDCVGSIVGSAAVASILPVNSYYLENTASLSDGTAMLGVGVAEGETPADTEGVTESKTAEEFASGEITSLLNNGVQNGTQIWYQTLKVDEYPLFEGETVYKMPVYADCTGAERVSYCYSNSPLEVFSHTLNEWGRCTVCSEYATPDYFDGYYLISTPGELYWFADYVNHERYVNARLVADITINENVLTEEGELNGDGSDFLEWTPIGYGYHQQEEIWWYEGTFLGDGYTISGLYVNQATYYNGLFASIDGNSLISGVNVTNSYIYGDFAAGIVSYLKSGTVENCSFDGLVVGTDEECGGIVSSSGGTVKNCANYGTVRADYTFVGGVVGYSGGIIENCYNYGTVTGRTDYVGSIAGISEGRDSYISNCYYLENTAFLGDGTAMSGAGVSYGETPSDAEGVTESKTAEEFASGEVTYLLNDGVTDGTQIWYQTLETDAYPVFEGKTVYEINVYSDCTKAEFTGTVYSNKFTDTAPHLEYDNGFCVVCQGFKEPELSSDRYLISNAGELYWFAEQVNSGNNAIDGKLTADITINENLLESLEYDENGNVTNGDSFRQWTPIGYCNSDGERIAYDGYFYGGSYDISGLYFNDSTRDYAGLFGCVGEKGEAVSIDIKDSYICGNNYVGAIAGELLGLNTQYNYNYSVVKGNNYVGGIYGYTEDNTYGDKNYGEVSGVEYVGGVAGYTTNTLNNNGNEGTVNGSEYVGGLAGYSKSIYESYNKGNVSGSSVIGGISGMAEGYIEECYNTGTVTGSGYVGGICGYTDSKIKISICYNTGEIDGYIAGGIAGYCDGITVENCYNTGNVGGSNLAGGIAGMFTGSQPDSTGIIKKCYNTGEISAGGGDIAGYLSWTCTAENCYGLGSLKGDGTGTFTDSRIATESEFASGKIAYLLNGSTSEGSLIWYQIVDEPGATPKPSPTFSGRKVLYYEECKSRSDFYTNIEHDGLCYGCGFDEPALSEDGYYEISTVSELYWFARYVNETDAGANGRLVNDIEVNPAIKCDSDGTALTDTTGFYIWRDEIGDYTGSNGLLYSGTFDGCGYIITGLYKESTYAYVGLFGGVSGVVKNVGLYGCFFGEEPVVKNGGNNVGGIAGYSRGTIENCFLSDSCIEGDMCVGGIVGYADLSSKINNCYNADENGRPYVISDWNVGSRVGGIAGESYGSITNCYSTAYVKGNTLFGAICGLTSRNAENTNNFYIKRSVYRPNASTYGWLAFGGADYYSSFPDEGRATQYATIDDMLTGEMAYLLQSANTEQVWGMKMNSHNYSYLQLPVIDTTGIYKVAKVGDTGNYSVASIGDTNYDENVDVLDYQELVNRVLADDHEQIGTESYDDIIRYDLDGDGCLDVIDASIMHLFINGLTTIKVYAPGDINCDGRKFYNEEEILLLADKMATPERLSTSEKYVCDMNADGKVNNEDLVILKEKYPDYFTTE